MSADPISRHIEHGLIRRAALLPRAVLAEGRVRKFAEGEETRP